MNDLLETPRLILGLRLVRWTAWFAVAFYMGALFALPPAEPLPSYDQLHLSGASTCGCALPEGDIS